MSELGFPVWTVAVTRDEPPEGPLHQALRAEGARPVACAVTEARPPADPRPLARAASNLESYAWMICASARAVAAVVEARSGPWPRGLRTAAVGAVTARALVEAGADPLPVVASESGSEALTRVLLTLDAWPGRRVLLPRAQDGRRDLGERLRAEGALVDEIEAYRMLPRPDSGILEAWTRAKPDAAVIASPQAAAALVRVLGAGTLLELQAVIAIGATTAAALSEHGIAATIPENPSFSDIARRLGDLAGKGR